ncbi:NAD-dependent epimerase/dehydratase family protein [Trinickia mobilis]|uniref:NAD-dependent epimerase/dehydratase family protein n=1 Tax=Trinickia mobilis TaxID=2816356 RepID=UPI001A8EEB85|nr:NAD-dependent epimerase/dehydratase family protein [Trinickia mobilis]
MNATRILRRPRVLIVGCGDAGMRCVERLRGRARIVALTSHRERVAELRAAGATPIVGDLDVPRSLRRLGGLAPTVLHLAPPQKAGGDDCRTRALIAALSAPRRHRSAFQGIAATGRLRTLRAQYAGISAGETAGIVPDGPFRSVRRTEPVRVVYASTTGVYGDCGGALIDETRPVKPANDRAKRRVSAERQLRRASARGALAASIVRIPGIYALNRLPLPRLEKRTPALVAEDDVYTNHIHADDLAAILLRAATHARVGRVIHASDDSALKMGEYFDRVADAFGLTRAPRITREAAEQQLEPMLLSFMRESRRLSNARLKRELRIRLRYPSVDDFLRTVR